MHRVVLSLSTLLLYLSATTMIEGKPQPPRRHIIRLKSTHSHTKNSNINQPLPTSSVPDHEILTKKVHEHGHPSMVKLVSKTQKFISAELSDEALSSLQQDESLIVEHDPPRYMLRDEQTSSSFLHRTLLQTTNAQLTPWGIKRVQADLLQYQGGVKVCIVDSGYLLGHPDLPTQDVNGTSEAGLAWSADGCTHGTHVAGTIAALNNALGVVGVAASASLPLFIVRVFDNSCGWVYSSGLAVAIDQCVANGARVINLSLGSEDPAPMEQQAFQRANAAGVLSIAAAGNSGSLKLEYPAAYPEVMSVGALDINNKTATFSTFNAQVEISAPGVEVLSTVGGFGIRIGSKKYAAMHVKGSQQGFRSYTMMDCGLGENTCTGATGKLCVMQLDPQASVDFQLNNCKVGGGIAAIIYNNVPGIFEGNIFESPLTAVTVDNGVGSILKLVIGQNAAQTVDILSTGVPSYLYQQGTSMATPHVTGVAALIWSYSPQCTSSQIRRAMVDTAIDLGTPGRDNHFGFGLVQAKLARDRLSVSGCAASPSASPTTSAPTVKPTAGAVSFDATQGSKMSTYRCDQPGCRSDKLWTITGTCTGAGKTWVLSVSPQLTDFGNQNNKELRVLMNDSPLTTCTNMGQCIVGYQTGACLSKRNISQFVTGVTLKIGLQIGSAVAGCPVNGTYELDSRITVACDVPSTTGGSGGSGGSSGGNSTAVSLDSISCPSNRSGTLAANGESRYTWVSPTSAPTDGTTLKVTFDLCQSTFDTVLKVYEKTSTGVVNELFTCDDCGGCGRKSKATFSVGTSPIFFNRTYLVGVDGFESAAGHFVVSTSCQSVTTVSIPTVTCGETKTGTLVANTEVKFRFQSPLSSVAKVVIVDLCASAFDTILKMYSSTGLLLTEIDDLECGRQARKQFTLGSTEMQPNTMYDFGISGYGGTAGAYSMIVSCPNVIPTVTTKQPSVSQSINCGGTISSTLANSNSAVTHQFTTPSSVGNITVSVCNSNFDTILTVLDGTTSTPVRSCDDNCGCPGVYESRLHFSPESGNALVAAKLYSIEIRGWAGGNYQLIVSCSGANPTMTTSNPTMTTRNSGSTVTGTPSRSPTQVSPPSSTQTHGLSVITLSILCLFSLFWV